MTRTEANPIDWQSAPTAPFGEKVRLGTRRLTSAHLALSRRPVAQAELSGVLAPIAQALSARLKAPVQLSAALIDRGLFRAPELTAGCGYAVVELGALDAVAMLELDLLGVVALVERLSGASSHPSPVRTLSTLEESAFGYLGLVALSAVRGLPRLAALAPRLLWVGTDRAAARSRLADRVALLQVEVELRLAEACFLGRLWLPAAPLTAALLREPPELTRELAPEVAAAGLTARVFMGRSALQPIEVENLRLGDVVLFDEVALRDGAAFGPIYLAFPDFTLRGALTAEGLLPTHATLRGATPEVSMSAEPSELTVVGLPLEIEVELTRVRVSLAELAQLKKGALLPLRVGVSEPVTLRVGDRAVARAELVDIEGEVGARVLSLLP